MKPSRGADSGSQSTARIAQSQLLDSAHAPPPVGLRGRGRYARLGCGHRASQEAEHPAGTHGLGLRGVTDQTDGPDLGAAADLEQRELGPGKEFVHVIRRGALAVEKPLIALAQAAKDDHLGVRGQGPHEPLGDGVAAGAVAGAVPGPTRTATALLSAAPGAEGASGLPGRRR